MPLTTLGLTGLEVPHTDYQLTGIEHMRTRNGVAFRALVNDRNHCLGVIENDGHGGGTWFYPNTAADRQAMDRFVAACRCNGRAVSAEDVYELFVDQYELSRQAARCEREGSALLRGVDNAGAWHGVTVVTKVPPIWLARGDHPHMSHLVRDLAQYQPAPDVWQFWDGTRWQDLALPAAGENA
ncbi:hypothetical protein [Streptomyces sp. SM12]|uniref:hypothetical protein n=1 Tax=Streptomyces sp. SM12 TaxID=1071602 RepID=UPI000CD4BDC1|nr:hypothetical protein [Streptomyces sp. SM12]